MSLDTALTIVALAGGLYAGWRMLGRSLRATWARLVSSDFGQAAWAWVLSWGQVPDTGQPDTSINTDIYQEPETTPAPLLTERDGVQWLARKKTVDGKWAMSANAIYEIVKGNRNEVMSWIRDARQEAPATTALTPYAGRPYDPKQYQHDDPELAYEAPPR